MRTLFIECVTDVQKLIFDLKIWMNEKKRQRAGFEPIRLQSPLHALRPLKPLRVFLPIRAGALRASLHSLWLRAAVLFAGPKRTKKALASSLSAYELRRKHPIQAGRLHLRKSIVPFLREQIETTTNLPGGRREPPYSLGRLLTAETQGWSQRISCYAFRDRTIVFGDFFCECSVLLAATT